MSQGIRHIPSEKALVARNALNAPQLRKLLVLWRYREIKTSDMLNEANQLLDGNGIEHLGSRNGRAVAYYVNMGDPYISTLILDQHKRRVLFGGWGDWVEVEERNGNKFD